MRMEYKVKESPKVTLKVMSELVRYSQGRLFDLSGLREDGCPLVQYVSVLRNLRRTDPNVDQMDG